MESAENFKRCVWKKDDLTCRPLDTYYEIMWFLDNPPAWRTLSTFITPHSKHKIKNKEFISHERNVTLERPETFCHYDPDTVDSEAFTRYDENTLPRTLVCHDMANGYHDDSEINGTAEYAAYTFYNWAGIDIFCYFSHHLLTIPPLAWINAGHAHGVKVIGTLITEWNEGTSFWDRVLKSEADYTNFANTLVTIASIMRFDGWLLNIENKVNDAASLLKFVTYLKQQLHTELPDGLLIWYDSVTIKGNLNWQNGLSEKNKPFFDACDGIFTNYSWDEKDLQASVELAGDRILDVFVGIDVWGRNFIGGGMFNTQQAVKLVYEKGCSMAVFAPAWTHEALSSDRLDVNGVAMSEGLDHSAQFLLRDRALWGSLWPFLYTRAPCQLPFRTNFCRGFGKQRRIYGEVLCNTPWFNLRHQQYQPNCAHGPHGYELMPFELDGKAKKAKNRGILRNSSQLDSFSKTRLASSKTNLNSTENESILNLPSSVSKEKLRFKEDLVTTDDKMEKHKPLEDKPLVKKVSTELIVEASKELQKKISPITSKTTSKTSSTILPDQIQNSWMSYVNHFKNFFKRIKAVKNSEAAPTQGNKQSEQASSSKSIDTISKPIASSSLEVPQNSESSQNKEDKISQVTPEVQATQTPQGQTLQLMTPSASDGILRRQSEPLANPPVHITQSLKIISPQTSVQSYDLQTDTQAQGSNSEVDKDNSEDPYPMLIQDSQELARAERSTLSNADTPSSGTALDQQGKSTQTLSVNIKLGVSTNKVVYGLTYVPGERDCLELYLEDAFNGGSCLCINPSDSVNYSHRYTRLFLCDFLLESGCTVVCIATKKDIDYQRQSLNTILSMKNARGASLRVSLLGRRLPPMRAQSPAAAGALSVPPLDVDGDEFQRLRAALLLQNPSYYVPVENSFNWKIRYYKLNLPGCRIREVSCHTMLEKGPILLGHFSIMPIKGHQCP